MPALKRLQRSLWVALSLLAILNIVGYGVSMMAAEDTRHVLNVPDDAYYYLTLARHFSDLGIWTFDGGNSVTSGFHLLWAYLLSGIYRLGAPTLDGFVRAGIALTLLFTLLMLAIAWKFSLSSPDPYPLLSVALVASSGNMARNAVYVVEWPLVILIAVLYAIAAWRDLHSEAHGRYAIILFVLGILGSLSRTDFGLLPLSLFIAGLLLLPLRPLKVHLSALCGLVGASCGMLIVFLHNYLFTGAFLQSSARMKAHWMSVLGQGKFFDNLGVVGTVLCVGRPVVLLIWLAACFYLLVVAVLERRKTGRIGLREHRPSAVMLVAAMLCVLGYTLFYSRNSAIQPWYTANFLVPVMIIVSITLSYVVKTLGLWAEGIVCFTTVALVAGNLVNAYADTWTLAQWPHQSAMLSAAEYITVHEFEGKVGAWNAGVIGYYSGGRVVNLDGLVNNDIYAFARENQLPQYISDSGMLYIADFECMLADPELRQRGGYDDPDFLRSLRVVETFEGLGPYWRRLSIYQVMPE